MSNTCPHCGERVQITIYDRGLRRFLRLMASNNRYWCVKCNATWRKKDPEAWVKLRKDHMHGHTHHA